jgi:toluene monooxygenase system protein E
MADPKSEVLKPLRTWSHLAKERRKPSEYEIVSVKTLHNTRDPDRPMELDKDVFANRWLRKYRNESPLQHPDWHGFRDPDEIIYRNYTVLQNGQEFYIEGLLNQHDEFEHDKGLTEEWVRVLATRYTPMRYLWNTTRMVASYIVSVSPTSTINNCAAFQSADDLRWLQWVAYRTVELERNLPGFGFGETERGHWEDHPSWQGGRELIEKLLIAYDWGESFVGLNLVAKPAIDEGVLRPLARAARRNNDGLLSLLLEAQLLDSERSRRWSRALVRYAVAGNAANADVISSWIDKWMALATNMIESYCEGLPDVTEGPAEAAKAIGAFHAGLGLSE